MRYHLMAMDMQEMVDYIRHHLKVAGIASPLFTDGAHQVIFEYSGGIARKVNNVCLSSLLCAAMRNKQLIDDHLVKEVIENEFGT